MPTETLKEKLSESSPTIKEPYWVAIIYRPKKESSTVEDVDSVDYNENKRPTPVYVRQIMLPPVQSSTGHGAGPSFDWIELRPGANIQITYADWQRAAAMPIVKPLIGLSIDVVATSSSEDDTPGYKHFTSTEAVKLIKLTTSSTWIDDWMNGETRAEVIKASNERKAYLEAELAKRTS